MRQLMFDEIYYFFYCIFIHDSGLSQQQQCPFTAWTWWVFDAFRCFHLRPHISLLRKTNSYTAAHIAAWLVKTKTFSWHYVSELMFVLSSSELEVQVDRRGQCLCCCCCCCCWRWCWHQGRHKVRLASATDFPETPWELTAEVVEWCRKYPP